MAVELHRSHPEVQAPWSEWSEDQTLHVATAYSNPFRWKARRENANNFRRHMAQSPNVKLHLVELAYGDRPHELVDPSTNPLDVALRTRQQELFFKENLLKLGVRSFPEGWKYGMICDADFHFTRHDWALETVHQLQHHAFVQPFSSYADVSGGVYGQGQIPVRYNSGFFFNYIQNGYQVSPNYHNGVAGDVQARPGVGPGYDYESVMIPGKEGTFMRGVGATGGALAFTREAYDACGPFPDRCILGHADWYVAFSLVGVEPPDIHTQKYHPNYKVYVNNWRDKAQAVRKNVGYTDCHAIHYWHGSKTRRAYSSRDVILANNQYD